jgi:hypothetical protein
MSNQVNAWSFSALKLYEECPAKYKYEKIDKIAYEKPPAMQRGIDIHKKCENYLNGDDPDQIPPELEEFDGLFQDLHGMDNIVEQQWGFTVDWKPTGWFAKGKKATWLRVVLDDLVLYEDGTALVIDFKTGKPYGDYSEQMSLFADAVFCRYHDVKSVETRLWFLDTGDEVVDTLTRKGLAARKKEWEDRVEPMFNDTAFRPKPNRRCSWCPFSVVNDGPCKY